MRSESELPQHIKKSLCAKCKYHRLVISGKGSKFIMCLYYRQDSSRAKYPPLPVEKCRDFEEKK